MDFLDEVASLFFDFLQMLDRPELTLIIAILILNSLLRSILILQNPFGLVDLPGHLRFKYSVGIDLAATIDLVVQSEIMVVRRLQRPELLVIFPELCFD